MIEESLDRLIKNLEDSNWSVRRDSARALGEIGGECVVEPLIEALGDDDGDVREATTWALGKIGDARGDVTHQGTWR